MPIRSKRLLCAALSGLLLVSGCRVPGPAGYRPGPYAYLGRLAPGSPALRGGHCSNGACGAPSGAALNGAVPNSTPVPDSSLVPNASPVPGSTPAPSNSEALPGPEKGPSLDAPAKAVPEKNTSTLLDSFSSWKAARSAKADKTEAGSSSTSWTWPSWKMPRLLGAKAEDSKPMPKASDEVLPPLSDSVSKEDRLQPEPEESLPPVAFEKGAVKQFDRTTPPPPPTDAEEDVPLDPSTVTPGRPVNALPAPTFQLPKPGQKTPPPAPPADDDAQDGPMGLTPAQATHEGRGSSTPPADFNPMHGSNPLPSPFEFTPSEPQVISPNTAGQAAPPEQSVPTNEQDSGPSLFQSSYKAQNGAKAATAQPASMSVSKPDNLKISQFALCSTVRGFGDVVPLESSKLHSGQRLVIYAAVENLRTENASGGIRTYTFSAWELCTPKGEVYHHDPLGTASDVTPVARSHFYLAHTVSVPPRMPPGKYELRLQVYDMIGRQTTVAQIPVRVE